MAFSKFSGPIGNAVEVALSASAVPSNLVKCVVYIVTPNPFL